MLFNELKSNGQNVIFIDGDEVRKTLCSDLGFSDMDRMENIRRVASVARIVNNSGCCAICCFVSPSISIRELARSIIGGQNFVEIFIDTPVQECINRDPKGMYKRALNGQINDFTGVNAPFEVPVKPDIHILNNRPLNESFDLLMDQVRKFLPKTDLG